MVPAALGFGRDPDGRVRAELVAGGRRHAGRARSSGGASPLGTGADARRRARRGARRGASAGPMTYDVTLIPGDGIGPEITAQTVRVLEATRPPASTGTRSSPAMAAVEATGTPLPDATVESIRKNALALKGPLTTPVGTGFRSVNVGLRKEFELFANVRPGAHHRAGRPVRERGHRAGAREPRGPLHRRRALRPDRRRPARRGRVDGHRHPRRLRADRALRLRVRAQARAEEGHDRPQGQHPQDGERALPRGGPRGRARSTRAGWRRTT